MKIIHLSAECYPAAKAGGLGDVVGSLPKYLNVLGEQCEVVIPKYHNHWLNEQEFEVTYESRAPLGAEEFGFSVQRLKDDLLGFPFYAIDIPGRFDRPGVYIDPWSGHGYWDEFERAVSFQVAALDWINSQAEKPEVIHCHDHHTGLVPFMMSQCNRFDPLKEIPTVITVHNAEYHGEQDRGRYYMLPAFPYKSVGLLDWHGSLNSLGAGLKCAWKITTVSPNYMNELSQNSNGLEQLFEMEKEKSVGILNGIDNDVWNPATDEYLAYNFSYRNRLQGKKKNKEALCGEFDLDPSLPTIAFIGRLVREKGADLLPDLIKRVLHDTDRKANFILLGTGNPQLHEIFSDMNNGTIGYFDARLEYNERLAHQMYAGSDFVLMPSRVEPCGLNQLFAMRYGTIPIVRTTGGLKDTVKDLNETDGYGIRFDNFTLEDAEYAIYRAIDLFEDKNSLKSIISKIMKLDFSWKKSAKEYQKLYHSLITQRDNEAS